MPVSLSTCGTRSSGTPRSPQRVTVLLLTEHIRAKSTGLRPFSAKRRESEVLIGPDSCTTNNNRQGAWLHKSLTTDVPEPGILATMQKRLQKPLASPVVEIYGKRQPGRPHYLAELLRLHNVERSQLIEDLGVDKSVISRWLGEKRPPTTPGPDWAQRLGWYFAASDDPDDFVDIFTDPAVARFQRIAAGRSPEEVDRLLAAMEMALPRRKTGT